MVSLVPYRNNRRKGLLVISRDKIIRCAMKITSKFLVGGGGELIHAKLLTMSLYLAALTIVAVVVALHCILCFRYCLTNVFVSLDDPSSSTTWLTCSLSRWLPICPSLQDFEDDVQVSLLLLTAMIHNRSRNPPVTCVPNAGCGSVSTDRHFCCCWRQCHSKHRSFPWRSWRSPHNDCQHFLPP